MMLRGQLPDSRSQVRAWLTWTIVGVFLVVLQTTILSLPGLKGLFYDLLVPLIAFFALNLPRNASLAFVVLIGFLMDLFSGGVFGLYLSLYFWIVILGRGTSGYFDVKGAVFRSIFVALCVLGEHVVFYFFATRLESGLSGFGPRAGELLWQVLLAFMTGPAVLSGFEKIHSKVGTQEIERVPGYGHINLK